MINPEDTSIGILLFLLVMFTVKHYLADFLLQTPYMLRKMQRTGWVLPLLSHSAVHGAMSAGILAFPLGFQALWFGLLDLVIHFALDYWIAKTRWQIHEKQFWNALGLNQMLHHLSYLPLAYMALHFSR